MAADSSVVQFIQTEKTKILSQTFMENHNLSFALVSISLAHSKALKGHVSPLHSLSSLANYLPSLLSPENRQEISIAFNKQRCFCFTRF